MSKESQIVYQGKMFEVVHFEPKPGVTFETAVRAPGVRLLIEHVEGGQKGLLMTSELRHDRELSMQDYRLPGGKIFDTLDQFNLFRESDKDIKDEALRAARLEAKQEAGIEGGSFTYINKAKAGGSVEWDLYYFLVRNAELGNQELEDHEKGEIDVVFLSYKDIFEKLLNKEINEGRTADVLWRYLANNNFISFT